MPSQRSHDSACQLQLAELYDWYRSIRSTIFKYKGIQSADIDEYTNRINVTVSNPDAIRYISKLMKINNIPKSAYVIDYERDVITTDTTLRSAQTDVSGGLEIRTAPNGGGGSCTLGLVVEINNVRGILTASHCSAFQITNRFGT